MKSIAIFALALCIVAISIGSARAGGAPFPALTVNDAVGNTLGLLKDFTPDGGATILSQPLGLLVNLNVTGNVAAFPRPLFFAGSGCNGPGWVTDTPPSLQELNIVVTGPGNEIGRFRVVPGIPGFYANSVSFPQRLPGGGDTIICAPFPNSLFGSEPPFIDESNGFPLRFFPLPEDQLNAAHLPVQIPVQILGDP